jgi:hypothetical protein
LELAEEECGLEGPEHIRVIFFDQAPVGALNFLLGSKRRYFQELVIIGLEFFPHSLAPFQASRRNGW